MTNDERPPPAARQRETDGVGASPTIASNSRLVRARVVPCHEAETVRVQVALCALVVGREIGVVAQAAGCVVARCVRDALRIEAHGPREFGVHVRWRSRQ